MFSFTGVATAFGRAWPLLAVAAFWGRRQGPFALSAYFDWAAVTRLVSIPSRAGFLAARDSGIKAVASGFVLQAAPTASDGWRLGLLAKKTGNAVRRTGRAGVFARWRGPNSPDVPVPAPIM